MAKNSFLQPKDKIKKLDYLIIAAVVLFMLYNLISLGQQNILAYSNQTTTLYLTISAGILDIISASSSNSFSPVTVQLSTQTSTASDLGAFRVSDVRGSGAGWVVNLSGNDWTGDNGLEEIIMQLDYDNTGSDNDLGKLCLITNSGAILSIAGQDTSNIDRGDTDCFSDGVVTQIDIYTAASSYGKGDYWITDFSLEQYIPSNPTAQNLTTTLVLTVS